MAGETLSFADLLSAPQLSMFALAPEGKEILWHRGNLARAHRARPGVQANPWDGLLKKAKAAG